MAVPDPDIHAKDTDGVSGDAVRSIAAAAFLTVFALGATYMALDFGDEARRLPLVVGVPLSLMALINLVLTVRQALRPTVAGGGETDENSGQPADPESSDQSEESRDVDPVEALRAAQASVIEFEDTGEGLSFRAALTAVVVVSALFMLLGLIPATVLYVTGYVRFVGRESWVKSLGMSAILVFVFWIFRTLLNVRFYEGWLAVEGHIPYLLPF